MTSGASPRPSLTGKAGSGLVGATRSRADWREVRAPAADIRAYAVSRSGGGDGWPGRLESPMATTRRRRDVLRVAFQRWTTRAAVNTSAEVLATPVVTSRAARRSPGASVPPDAARRNGGRNAASQRHPTLIRMNCRGSASVAARPARWFPERASPPTRTPLPAVPARRIAPWWAARSSYVPGRVEGDAQQRVAIAVGLVRERPQDGVRGGCANSLVGAPPSPGAGGCRRVPEAVRPPWSAASGCTRPSRMTTLHRRPGRRTYPRPDARAGPQGGPRPCGRYFVASTFDTLGCHPSERPRGAERLCAPSCGVAPASRSRSVS